jgi:hypothetical protein
MRSSPGGASVRYGCTAIGLPDRIVHDLRRSGVKHLIGAGVDPHAVMAFSGHRTHSMLKRYHIIALDDLRAAAARGSAYVRRGHCEVRDAWNTERTRRVAPLTAGVAELAER